MNGASADVCKKKRAIPNETRIRSIGTKAKHATEDMEARSN
jgi:hypothetical protein